ncbi:MAG: glycosyltransferase family 4 protein [Candidatus Didemnitutus sp.]|nr:glycosyltransferase family 4 protein [Candidatus Didemnitutus sp.]
METFENRRLRLALVIPTMQAGGAERVMSLIARHFDAGGHVVAIFTLEPAGTKSFYSLPERVRHLSLGMEGTPHGLARRLRAHGQRVFRLRAALRAFQPDLVISFCTEMNVLCSLAVRGSGWPLIVSERVDPLMHRPAWPWQFARWLVYRCAASVVVQSEEMRAYFMPWGTLRLRVIPNPVPPASTPARTPSQTILAVGRLARQKGFDYLLPALACVAERFPDWRLRIIGEGGERARLEKQAAELGLRDRVDLPGLRPEIGVEYAGAKIFVLPSRYEGFPNALVEAMAAGLPVVAAQCRGGIAEIIRDGQNGLLFPPGNVPVLAEALERLMGSADLRERLGGQASRVAETYSVARVMAQWEQAVAAALKSERAAPKLPI